MPTTKIRQSFIVLGFIIVSTISHNTYAFLRGGDSDEGNGGDVIECSYAPEISPFSGLYSLDYVVSYIQSTNNADIKKINSWEESERRFAKILDINIYLSSQFKEFTSTLKNYDDFYKPRIWIEKPFGLIDLKDEDLIEKIPDNCKDINGKPRIHQVVRREAQAGQITRYYFNRELLNKVRQSNELQYSFIIIHEFLWDFFEDAKSIRLVNRLLHSKKVEEYSKDELKMVFINSGLVIRDYTNYTPDQLNRKLLHDASYGNLEFVKQWISLGADINTTDTFGYTPLMNALRRDFIDTALYLLKKGAFVDIQAGSDFETPLMLAITTQSFELVNIIIKRGARINLKNIEYASAITRAVVNLDFEIIKLLLENGAHPCHVIPDFYPDTPTLIDYAVRNQQEDIVEVLLQYKAFIDNDTIEIAKELGNQKILKLLLDTIAQY